MSNLFCIFGEDKKRDEQLLQVIEGSGLETLYLSPLSTSFYHDVAPAAVLFGHGVKNRRGIVDRLKAQRAMVSVPIIATLTSPERELVEAAFRDGVDEYIVDGAWAQLAEVARVLEKRTLTPVQETAGTVLVADPSREARMRFAHTLRRGGFDVHFASDCVELENSLREIDPRAVIATPGLPGGPLTQILETVASEGNSERPWIVISSSAERNTISSLIAQNGPVSFVDDDLVENISFKINELLNPETTGRRNSKRLLYGTPVHFDTGNGLGTFYGYSYNVNLGGIFVRTLTPPEYGTEIDIKFSPPFGKGYLAVKAQVTWLNVIAGQTGKMTPPGMGVQFLEWDLADWAGFEAGYGALLAKTSCSKPAYWESPESIPSVAVAGDETPTYLPASV